MSIFVDEVEVSFGTYPNGEAVVPKFEPFGHNWSVPTVRLHWEDDRDLVHLALVRSVVRDYSSMRELAPKLFVDYMPYSRMDRAQDGYCFSLHVVAKQLNAMKWQSVQVVEPHSKKTLSLVGNSEPVWATAKLTPTVLELLAFDPALDYVVLPDTGARERYEELMPTVLDGYNLVVLRKTRDFGSGKITGLEVDHRVLRGTLTTPPRKALIIDDLCSRGGTFVAAASLLRQLGASDVSLLVTHMEPAGLTGDLPDKLDHVFCTDTMTFPTPVPANFTVFPRGAWL